MSQIEKYVISLDKYQEVKRIAEGAYGTILLVEDKETHKKYAAKIIKYNDEATRNRCLESIEFMGQHHQPFLVNFIGYSPVDFEGNENLTIILDYASNGDLSDLIKTGKLDNTQRQIILVGICRAMMYLHQNSYMHRDIKPNNVVIDENFHPLLTGFSLMTKYEQGKKYECNCGTPLYMAPEIISEEEYGLKADVYSYAILMYQVITETNPAEIYGNKITNYHQLLKLVQQGQRPEFKSPVKKSIQTVIEQCWSAKPSDRLTFDQLFQKLAYDPECYLDDVDANKVKSYADSIKQ
ncbi:hypothetical protein M9Y10_029447 [Tritrichomonas musculus]|uniref:Protein kinase domain-containing protein n=1 Tax=Tritrichomonas musculus TaxID=1915356 RepID=A0ABR2KM61_9EUKA